jgi:hypothetical protein
MVNFNCDVCGEQKMLQNMHNRTRVQLSEKYHHVFGTSVNEGRVCKQCYNILSALQHDHNLVSRLREPIPTYTYTYLTFNYIIYICINYHCDVPLNYYSQVVHYHN